MNTPFFAASIMAADAARLGDEIAGLAGVGVDMLHWDIMDGHFVPNLTFGAQILKAVRQYTDLPFDVHLMVDKPLQWFEAFTDAGADAITFHVEAVDDPYPLLVALKNRGCKAGLALNPATPLTAIDPAFFELLDRLLVMSVNPGFGGQSYIDQTDKIRAANKLRVTYPRLDIMVDGGINLQTAPNAVAAGATSLVSGSAFFKAPDRAAFVAQLKRAA